MFASVSYKLRSFFFEIDRTLNMKKRELEESIKHEKKLQEIRSGYTLPPTYYASLIYARLFGFIPAAQSLVAGAFVIILFSGGYWAISAPKPELTQAKKETTLTNEENMQAISQHAFIETEAFAAINPKPKPKLSVETPPALLKQSLKTDAEEKANTPLPAIAEKGGSYLILVDKKKRRMWLYEKLPKRYFLVESFPVSVGRLMGNKQAEGDLRTPEGSYKVVKIKTDSELPSQYGPFAFVLNYPNAHDRKLGKTGSGIWIHGSGANKLTPDTKGCVELSNRNLLRLRNYIYKDIPVYIYPSFPKGIQGEQEMPLALMNQLLAKTEQS